MGFWYIHWTAELLLATLYQFLDDSKVQGPFLTSSCFLGFLLFPPPSSLLCFSLCLSQPLPFPFPPPSIRKLIQLYNIALWGNRSTLAVEQDSVFCMAWIRMQRPRARTRSKYSLVAYCSHPPQVAMPHLRTKNPNMSLCKTLWIQTMTPNSPNQYGNMTQRQSTCGLYLTPEIQSLPLLKGKTNFFAGKAEIKQLPVKMQTDRLLTSQGSGFSWKELYEASVGKLGDQQSLMNQRRSGTPNNEERTQATDSTGQCGESIMMRNFTLKFSDLSIKNCFL